MFFKKKENLTEELTSSDVKTRLNEKSINAWLTEIDLPNLEKAFIKEIEKLSDVSDTLNHYKSLKMK